MKIIYTCSNIQPLTSLFGSYFLLIKHVRAKTDENDVVGWDGIKVYSRHLTQAGSEQQPSYRESKYLANSNEVYFKQPLVRLLYVIYNVLKS